MAGYQIAGFDARYVEARRSERIMTLAMKLEDKGLHDTRFVRIPGTILSIHGILVHGVFIHGIMLPNCEMASCSRPLNGVTSEYL